MLVVDMQGSFIGLRLLLYGALTLPIPFLYHITEVATKLEHSFLALPDDAIYSSPLGTLAIAGAS